MFNCGPTHVKDMRMCVIVSECVWHCVYVCEKGMSVCTGKASTLRRDLILLVFMVPPS